MDSKWDIELKKLVPKEEHRKTIAKVFDKHAIHTLHSLASKGYFEQIEFVISTGKEAHVFRAVDASGNFRAVKVYKTSTSDFKHMSAYVHGDVRFAKIKNDKLAIVKAWIQKEFKNLELARHARVRVPLPITFKNNVLVMEFVGKNGVAAPTLKEKPLQDATVGFETVIKAVADLLHQSRLVHADLSEYNILNNNEELVLIDIGQGVLSSHPNAKTFFERDVSNIVKYFQKHGVKTSVEKALEKIKNSGPKTRSKREYS